MNPTGLPIKAVAQKSAREHSTPMFVTHKSLDLLPIRRSIVDVSIAGRPFVFFS